MADPNNYAGAAVAPRVSPFDSLAEMVDRYREIQKHANAIADRISGQTPKDGSKALGEIAGGGLIDGLERQTGFLRSIAQDIGESLSRIENRL